MAVLTRQETLLIGRDHEISMLEDILAAVDVTGCAVVLLGDPGVGKSALQSAVNDRARERGFQVLSARGAEPESYLPFASLHQLLRPLFPQLERLSARQHQALLAAFGMSDATSAEPFLISLAVLELVVDAAREHPVLISLDDLQWMDQPSQDTLGFLARRLQGERVVLMASTRQDSAAIIDDPAIRRIRVGGLPRSAASALLDLSSPDLNSGRRDQILQEAGGNPLALLEFPVALAERSGSAGAAGELPMTVRLERAFAGRVRTLPSPTQTALLAAACNDAADVAEILAATAAQVGAKVGVEALEPAIDVGLIDSDGFSVHFRHPLVRSAIRHAATLSARVAVHTALAAVLSGVPDRATWHRAEAAAAPDEAIATEVEAAAVRLNHRGGTAAAVTWLERAAALSPSDDRRGARLISAAELAFELGQFAAVERLKSAAAMLVLQPRDQSRLTWLEGVFDDGTPGDAGQVYRLVDLARRALASEDEDLAVQLLVGAARRVWWGDPGAEARHAVAATATEIGLAPGDPRLLVCLSVAEPFEHGRYVVEQLTHWAPDAGGRPELAGLLGLAAFCAGDFAPAVGFLSSPVEALRSQGRFALLAQALALRAWSAIYIGTFEVARSAEEAIRLADETSQPVWGATARIAASLLGGLRGDPRAEGLLDEAGRTAAGSPFPMSSLWAGIQLARGVTDLGAGRYESAYGHLRKMFDPREPCFHHTQRFWSLSYLAEAAVHSGRRRECRILLNDLERLIGDRPCPTAETGLFFAHAVLADESSAESWYEAALIGPGSDLAWHRARIELNYGSWLRRHRRVRDSRDHLRSARQAFESAGATAWAHRADLELRATGEKGWAPSAAGSWDVLSPQEAQIAQLAAQGLSNKEISERLFLSHRTVGSHLYRMFPKLGITSRAQLATALHVSGDSETPLD